MRSSRRSDAAGRRRARRNDRHRMATALVISLSDLGSDPRVDRQIDFLRDHYRVFAAGFGPPAYDDVEFIDLLRPAASAPGRFAPRAIRLATGMLRFHRIGYWGEPD